MFAHAAHSDAVVPAKNQNLPDQVGLVSGKARYLLRWWMPSIVAAVVLVLTLDLLVARAKEAPPPKEITNSIGMQLVLIPAGKFQMGWPAEEKQRLDDEEPQREVEISKAFYLGKFEVTQAQYKKVMGKNPSWFCFSGQGRQNIKDVEALDTKDFPVEEVSWEDAKEFCRKLSELPEEKAKGRKYDLPTEAEWEYACRGGKETRFHFGSQLSGKEANCKGDLPYGTKEKGPNLGRTCKTGSYPANAFGLYDMHGNVSEWCQDWFDEAYYRSGDNKDLEGPKSGGYRLCRGGSWNASAFWCRAASRFRVAPDLRYNFIGFRVRLRLD
jgi:formylglycine-generating enzyme required for sulfatase activity